MKRLVLAAIGVLLTMVILTVGCTPQATPAPAPAPAAPTQNVTGVLVGINPPSVPGQDVIIIHTPKGDIQAIPFAPNYQFFIEGEACLLEDVLKIETATGVSYNCSIWYDDETGKQNIYITKQK